MEVLSGLLVLVGVAAGIIWSELSGRKKPKLNGEKLNILVDLARVAVSAAETLGHNKNLTGTEKYDLAYEALVELAGRIGITLSVVEAGALIHAVLNEVVPAKFTDDLV